MYNRQIQLFFIENVKKIYDELNGEHISFMLEFEGTYSEVTKDEQDNYIYSVNNWVDDFIISEEKFHEMLEEFHIVYILAKFELEHRQTLENLGHKLFQSKMILVVTFDIENVIGG